MLNPMLFQHQRPCGTRPKSRSGYYTLLLRLTLGDLKRCFSIDGSTHYPACYTVRLHCLTLTLMSVCQAGRHFVPFYDGHWCEQPGHEPTTYYNRSGPSYHKAILTRHQSNCWWRLASHQQQGHLETAPPFTVPSEGREARFFTPFPPGIEPWAIA